MRECRPAETSGPLCSAGFYLNERAYAGNLCFSAREKTWKEEKKKKCERTLYKRGLVRPRLINGGRIRAEMYCPRNRFYLFQKVIVPSCVKKEREGKKQKRKRERERQRKSKTVIHRQAEEGTSGMHNCIIHGGNKEAGDSFFHLGQE